MKDCEIIQNLVYFKCVIYWRPKSPILRNTGDNKSISMDHWQNNTGRTKPKYWQRNLSQCHTVHHTFHVHCCRSEHVS